MACGRLPGSSRVHASAKVEACEAQALHSAWADEACAQTISLHHCAVHQVGLGAACPLGHGVHQISLLLGHCASTLLANLPGCSGYSTM